MLRASLEPSADHIAVLASPESGIAVRQRLGGRLWRRCVTEVDPIALRESATDTVQRLELGLFYPYGNSTATVWADGVRFRQRGSAVDLFPDGGFENTAVGAFPNGWIATAGTWAVTDAVSLFGSRCLQGSYAAQSPAGPGCQATVSGDGPFSVGFYAAADTDEETAALVRSPIVHTWFRRADASWYQNITEARIAAPGQGLRPPCDLRLRRTGGVISAAFSLDGMTFTDLDEPLAVAFPDSAYIGLAVTAQRSDGVTSSVRARIPAAELGPANRVPAVVTGAAADPALLVTP